MSKVFLFGHTGSINRGCEAIVRSTIKLLKNAGIYDIYLVSSETTYDHRLGVDKLCFYTPIKKLARFSLVRIIFGIYKKLTTNAIPLEKQRIKHILNKIDKDDVVLVIGGDTYCYEKPYHLFAYNKLFHKRGAKVVLWSCSIENDLIDKDVLDDLNRYDYIFPREIITYNTLLKAGIPSEKIIQMSDSAFNLDTRKVTEFSVERNTVGINVSPIVIENTNVLSAVKSLIQYIIDNTDMNVLLIPHVYDNGVQDDLLLKKIKGYFTDNRVQVINKFYSCEEIKYIISKCRFFIGARTHATIAAYSTCVPTLVLGYSVKSRGIATDLFDTEDGYVVLYNKVINEDTLIYAFNNIMKNELGIKECLNKKMPEYALLGDKAATKIFQMGIWKKRSRLFYEESSCSGCGACALSCPKKCIEMKKDQEGFWYPHIDCEKCVDCGLCEKVCHCKGLPKLKNVQKVYGAYNKDKQIREKSSSGGIFNILAQKVLEREGVVFGAAFNEDFSVYHKYVTSKENLSELMGSKYVESKLGESYKQVKEFLQNERWVLFSGTPCQVAGLLKYLGKDYEKLITMDFICHGVPSASVWGKYISDWQEEKKSKLINVNFRNKTYGWKIFSLKLDFNNNTTYIGKVVVDKYLRAFINDICLRPSCYNCNTKGEKRVADITVGDFWNIQDVKSGFDEDLGTSLIIIRSDIADGFFESVNDSLEYFETDINCITKAQPSFTCSVTKKPLRNKFFRDLKNRPVKQVVEKYCGTSITSKIRRKTANLFFRER